ncbi:hypothetical protein ACFODZ_07465 [Marinicella sediminis]|uniref:ATP-binding protein n=1 Tax=Marinicella sediminis TaxID=1792834 RepID=A0ABV7J7G4_9GAMM|nr:hypothetical protein [Marinicella sediminis]
MLKKTRKIIPFGKVIEGGRQTFPQNEVYLGREKKRQQLMRWLTSLKPSGSILITGARGVGKSTFVKNVIGSMNVNLYERLKLKGYSVNWGDKLMILLVFIIISVMLTLFYELLSINTTNFLLNHIIWTIGMVPFLLMIYWGGLLKRAVVRINQMTDYEHYPQTDNNSELSRLYLHLCSLSTFLTLVGAAISLKFIHYYLLFYCPLFSTPSGNAGLKVSITMLFLTVVYFNRKYINNKCHLRKKLEKELSYAVKPQFTFFAILITVLTVFFIYFFEETLLHWFLTDFDKSWFFLFIIMFILVRSYFNERQLIKNIIKSSNPINKSKERYNRRANYLSQWTLNSVILRHYAPTIHVNINLGFSDLNHSNIIFSMLIDLRNKYREIFQSNNYGFLFIRHAFFFLAALLIWMSLDTINLTGFMATLNNYETKVQADSSATLVSMFTDNNKTSLSILDLAGVTIIFVLLNWIFIKAKLSRSSENLRRIDTLIEELATKSIKTKQGGMGFKIRGASLENKVIALNEREPLNSRLVETKLIWLLNLMKQSEKGWFFSPGKVISKPSPNILFVFDELDKLHDHSDNHNKLHPNDKRRNFTENEAARAKQIYRLLSDMKNLITTAPAKFIFIAGRDMRDQWLADANAREHFLSSIFEQEIFIPSLLTDHSDQDGARLSDNIHKFFKINHFKAIKKFEGRLVRHQNRNSLFSEKNEELLSEEYLLFNHTPLYKDYPIHVSTLSDENHITRLTPHNDVDQNRYINDYVSFLTYKSRGVPKQLKRLILENIESMTGFDEFDDALVFTENDICRIQFVAEVFYLIEIELGDYLINADDKMATSIFYLSDFVLKFNAHAFSWRHLFRLDELAHIHKLPELHNIFEKLVNHFTGFYLNKVLNGLYTFRFRSDVSKEIAYLSKVSDADSASYNFTLDESGDLKDIYRRKLDDNTTLNTDYRVGLGELYDLDREFEDAREHYIAAIKILDDHFIAKHQINGQSPLNDALIKRNWKSKLLNYNIKWGIERLGLMLQIGMTYERDNKLIYAFTKYKDARLFSRLLFKSYLGELSNNNSGSTKGTPAVDQTKQTDIIKNKLNKKGQRLVVVKHVNILFQAFFAEVWILEKLHNGVDSSIDVLEQGLQEFRTAISGKTLTISSGEGFSAQSETNFFILKSQFHNKAGDLYFFKGKKGLPDEKHCNDYLHRGIHHYRISLHEIRLYEQSRALASQNSLPVQSVRFPDHISLALSSNLLDLGESLVASVNLVDLLAHDAAKPNEVQSVAFEVFSEDVKKWIFLEQDEKQDTDLELNIQLNGRYVSICKASELFGKVADGKTHDLIVENQLLSVEKTLLTGLLASFSGVNTLSEAGYNEYASKEYHEQFHLILVMLYIKAMENPKTNQITEILIGLGWRLLESGINSTLKSKCGFKPPSTLNSGIAKPRLRPEIQSSALSFLFIMDFLIKSNAPSDFLSKTRQETANLYTDYFECTKEELNHENIITSMERLLMTHHYPMVNHLRTKNWLIFMYELNRDAGNANTSNRPFEYFSDIMAKYRIYDAPFIFTFAEVALSARVVTKSNATLFESDKIWLQKVEDKMISNCESMITMGKKYYEEIRNLYYLFDDFNDRRNHMGHTIQMLLISYLKNQRP